MLEVSNQVYICVNIHNCERFRGSGSNLLCTSSLKHKLLIIQFRIAINRLLQIYLLSFFFLLYNYVKIPNILLDRYFRFVKLRIQLKQDITFGHFICSHVQKLKLKISA